MSTRRGARRVVAATIVATAAWLVPMWAGSAAAAPADPCPGGALTTVYDDAGVARDACVAVAASEAPAVQLEAAPAVPERAPANSSLPSTGANATLLLLAGVLVAAGSAAQFAARRRS